MLSSSRLAKKFRSLRRKRTRHVGYEHPWTVTRAQASGVQATAGLLAALIVTGTPVAAAGTVPELSESKPNAANVISSIQSASHHVQQEFANMDPSRPQSSVLVDRTPIQPGPNALSPGLSDEDMLQITGVQHSMQGAAAEVANAAGIALRSAQGAEQSFETMLTEASRVPSYGDVQQALGVALHADLGIDATNALLGLGGSVIALVGVIAFQIQQRKKSEAGFQGEIETLHSVKSKLENRLNNLDQTKVSLEASLTSEKEDKTKALERANELDKRLTETTQSLDSKAAEQEVTAAKLQDTKKGLDKEKKAGAALGEQIIDLSKQIEQQTARAFKAEDVSGQLQKELSTKEKHLREECKKTSDLQSKLRKLEGTVQQMTASAQQQAASAQELRESASQAKTAADAAYQRVSTQLQLSMDQTKSLKKSLAQTDASLKKSKDGAAKLEGELKRTRAKADGLQIRLETTASDLQKAHDAIEKQQTANSVLKADNATMQERIKKLSSTLEATTLRLSSEVDVASDMKSQLAELKLEYIAAGDKLEAEQTHIKELQVDLRNMESALNAVSHDKKAAIMENAQLAAQLEGSQKSLMAAELAQHKTETELVNTQSMATELQQQLAAFESEMQGVIERDQAKEAELEKERSDRTAMEAQVDALKRQVVSIEQAERTAREQAQAAVVELRQEIEAARTRKRAMTKSSGNDSNAATKVPAMTSSKSGNSQPVADSKRSKST